MWFLLPLLWASGEGSIILQLRQDNLRLILPSTDLLILSWMPHLDQQSPEHSAPSFEDCDQLDMLLRIDNAEKEMEHITKS